MDMTPKDLADKLERIPLNGRAEFKQYVVVEAGDARQIIKYLRSIKQRKRVVGAEPT